MDDYSKRLILCFSEKLDHAKLGYISWDSFKLMAMRATFQQCSGNHNEEIYQGFLKQSQMWWDCLVRDVGADSEGRCHYIDMVNYVRKISKGAKGFDELPEFIRNLANMVFAMNDKNCDGKWDVVEYRNGSVGWCRYITDIAEIDAAYQAILRPQDADGMITFDRYKELVVEFFTTEDSKSPCRHIFGPLELNNIHLAITEDSKK